MEGLFSLLLFAEIYGVCFFNAKGDSHEKVIDQ